MEKFEIGYIAANFGQNIEKKIAYVLMRDNCDKSLLKTQFMQNIIKSRVNDLNEQVSQGEPVMSWKIAFANDTHSEMNNFLHSDKKSFNYSSIFNGIRHARNWSCKHETKYVKCTPNGRGSGAYVYVEKTGAHFQDEKINYQNKINQLNKLKQLIFK